MPWRLGADWCGLEYDSPITQVDWERPLIYLHRVRSIYFFSDAPSADLFYTISLPLPTEHIFPNLRTLVWPNPTPSTFPFLYLLIGPRISELEIGVDANVSHLSLLLILALKCPHLARLAVECDSHSYYTSDLHLHVSTGVSDLVRGVPQLSTLPVNALDEAAFEHLVALPSLTSLTMDNLKNGIIPATFCSKLSQISAFSNFQHLQIHSKAVDNTIALIAAMGTSRLEWVRLMITDDAFSMGPPVRTVCCHRSPHTP